MKAAMPALAALVLLGACHHKSATDQVADNLQAAAGQSDPAAAKVLDNAADALRNGEASTDQANASAQAALAAAGNATDAAEKPSSTTQAEPHKPGQPVPAAKIGDATGR